MKKIWFIVLNKENYTVHMVTVRYINTNPRDLMYSIKMRLIFVIFLISITVKNTFHVYDLSYDF